MNSIEAQEKNGSEKKISSLDVYRKVLIEHGLIPERIEKLFAIAEARKKLLLMQKGEYNA